MRKKLLKVFDIFIDLVYRTIITYGAVFILNAAFDFVLFRLLTGVFSVFAPLSQFLSYTASAVTRYFSYGYIRFNRTGEGHAVRFVRFVCVNFFIAVISPVILSLLLKTGLAVQYSKLAVLLLTGCSNFVFYKYIVFV